MDLFDLDELPLALPPRRELEETDLQPAGSGGQSLVTAFLRARLREAAFGGRRAAASQRLGSGVRVALSPDSDIVALLKGNEVTVASLPAETNASARAESLPVTRFPLPFGDANSGTGDHSMAWSPCGRFLAVAGPPPPLDGSTQPSGSAGVVIISATQGPRSRRFAIARAALPARHATGLHFRDTAAVSSKGLSTTTDGHGLAVEESKAVDAVGSTCPVPFRSVCSLSCAYRHRQRGSGGLAQPLRRCH